MIDPLKQKALTQCGFSLQNFMSNKVTYTVAVHINIFCITLFRTTALSQICFHFRNSLVLNNLFLKLVQSGQHYHSVGLFTKNTCNQVRHITFIIFPVYPNN
jgi:hypothetical protein